MDESLPKLFDMLEKRIEENGKRPFFVGNKVMQCINNLNKNWAASCYYLLFSFLQLSWADIFFYCAYEAYVDVKLADEIFKNRPLLMSIVNSVKTDPKMKTYLSQRPAAIL